MEISNREVKDVKEREFPEKIIYTPIGIIHTPFKELKGIPIQFSMSEAKGVIEIFPEYLPALKDLEGFSHIYCLFYFDIVKLPVPLQSKPFIDDEVRGVFAIRTPFRPNPIGISILKIEFIKENEIHVSNVDILNSTPILDIKPYISDFDNQKTDRNGWIEGKYKKMTS